MAKEKKAISTSAKIVTLGAAAAAAYWFYGSSQAAKHRSKARTWMLKARTDVQKAVKNATKKGGALDKDTYMKIVDTTLEKYSKLKDSMPAEMNQISREIKSAWSHVQKAGKSNPVKKVKKATKKLIKKMS